MTILEGLNVVEISGSGAAGVATKHFADWGATVTILEPADGTPLRRQPPLYEANGETKSGRWAWLSRGKTVVRVGPGSGVSTGDALTFCRSADVVIAESELVQAVLGLAPGDVESALVGEDGPTVVLVSPFGMDGPCASYAATDLGQNARGGWMVGTPGREPIRPGADVLFRVAGMWAFTGALVGLRHRRLGGAPQFVDLSMQAVAATSIIAQWLMPQASTMARPTAAATFPRGAIHCKDGIVGVSPLTPTHNEMLLRMLGMDDIVDSGNATPEYQAAHGEELGARAQPWFDARTRVEVMHEAQSWRLPAAPFQNVADRLDCEQLIARHYFEQVEIDGVPTKVPRVPYLLDGVKPIQRAEVTEADTLPSPPARAAHPRGENRQPFAGLRVLDLTWFWSGPSAMKLMGALGADVIKVEATQRLDPFRFSGATMSVGERWYETGPLWLDTNNNKRHLSLDLANPVGRELFVRLARDADIVISNFSNRVMPNLGLTNPELLQINPQLIAVTMPGYGADGPWGEYVGYGISFEQLCACASVTGYPDALPIVMGGFSDPLVGMHTVAAIELALQQRERTGTGVSVEIPQSETLDSIWAPEHIAVQHGAPVPTPVANSHPFMAPHNVYRASGEEQWLSIAVATDEQYRALARVLGLPEDGRFDTATSRKVNEDALDALLSEAVAHRDSENLEQELQAAGVMATRVFRAPTIHTEPNLNHRSFFQELDREVSGVSIHRTFPFTFSTIACRHVRPSPLLGEHNAEVLREVLTPTDPSLEELERMGVIGTISAGVGG